jgi:hypothetical protein
MKRNGAELLLKGFLLSSIFVPFLLGIFFRLNLARHLEVPLLSQLWTMATDDDLSIWYYYIGKHLNQKLHFFAASVFHHIAISS